jgi:predicted permease
LRALPGVTAVAATTVLPMSGLGALNDFAVEGAPPPASTVNQEIAVASVTPGYFMAVGTPLKRGRAIEDRDTAQSPPVAVINEAAVRRWFPDRDPVGRRVIISGTTYEVVGIVNDILQRDPGGSVAPQLFMSYAQRASRSPRLVIRTEGDPVSLAPTIRAVVRELDPNVAIPEFTPLDQLVATAVARPRFYMSLLTLFSAVALVLAATGIFGVMSYAVAQRSREISIRIALGALARDVLWMIVRRAVLLTGTGLVIGIAGALIVARVIQAQLFDVGLADPVTLMAVAVVLGTSAVLASLVPAWRATRVDPLIALKAE